MAQYGINIETIDRLLSTPKMRKTKWGAITLVASVPEYRFEQWKINARTKFEWESGAVFESTFFVEEGAIIVDKKPVTSRELITIPPKNRVTIAAKKNSVVYVFSGTPRAHENNYFAVSKTTDFRDKYWGTIETIVSRNYAAKRMLVRRNTSASLEFHCRKLESYLIHSGKLLLRLRAGRGEDRFFAMDEGGSALIPPGLMHQRGGIGDAVIIEISTKDEDSDSYLVEDGAKLPMPGLSAYTQTPVKQKADARRLCFDIDGLLCTQVTTGNYNDARPIPEAIKLVNKLYKEGHTIHLFTARFMGRHKNDWRKAYEDGYAFTQKQLFEWGVKFHELFLGKPNTDIFVDDRALFFKPDMSEIEKEIRKKL